jgi:hypothetical protein
MLCHLAPRLVGQMKLLPILVWRKASHDGLWFSHLQTVVRASSTDGVVGRLTGGEPGAGASPGHGRFPPVAYGLTAMENDSKTLHAIACHDQRSHLIAIWCSIAPVFFNLSHSRDHVVWFSIVEAPESTSKYDSTRINRLVYGRQFNAVSYILAWWW